MSEPTKKDNTYCCVPQCFSRASRCPELSFHLFPNEKFKIPVVSSNGTKVLVSRKAEWIRLLRIGRKVSSRMCVCSKHFTPQDYTASTFHRKRLKPYAVPSRFLPVLFPDRIHNFKKTAERELHSEEINRLEKWMSNIKLKPNLKKRPTICSDHFDLSCFTNTLRTRLYPDSVPTIQIPTYRTITTSFEKKSSEDNEGIPPVPLEEINSTEYFQRLEAINSADISFLVSTGNSSSLNEEQIDRFNSEALAIPEDTLNPTASRNLRRNNSDHIKRSGKKKEKKNIIQDKKTSAKHKDIEDRKILIRSKETKRIKDKGLAPSEIEIKVETATSSSSESSSDSDKIPLIPIQSGNSTILRNFEKTQSKFVNSPSSTFAPEEIPITNIKSEVIDFDDTNLQSVQENNNENHGEKIQSRFLNSVSKPEDSNISGETNVVTHADAFSAVKILLHYIMNQDDVNDAEINFILNLAKKIHGRLPVNKEIENL